MCPRPILILQIASHCTTLIESKAEPHISMTPTTVLVNFDVSTSHPHTPDECFLPSFTTTTNLLKSSSACSMTGNTKTLSVKKDNSIIFGFEWVCSSSKVGSDTKQLAPPGAMQCQLILQVIVIVTSLEGTLPTLMDLDWRTLSLTPYKYWTDQVIRTKMMKSIVKHFTPQVVDTQDSLVYK